MEGVALSAVARQFGTPCYVYSRAALSSAFAAFDSAFGAHPHLICYSVKANSNLSVLALLALLQTLLALCHLPLLLRRRQVQRAFQATSGQQSDCEQQDCQATHEQGRTRND